MSDSRKPTSAPDSSVVRETPFMCRRRIAYETTNATMKRMAFSCMGAQKPII